MAFIIHFWVRMKGLLTWSQHLKINIDKLSIIWLCGDIVISLINIIINMNNNNNII